MKASAITRSERMIFAMSRYVQLNLDTPPGWDNGHRMTLEGMSQAEILIDSVQFYAPAPKTVLVHEIELNGQRVEAVRIRDRPDVIDLTTKFGVDAYFARPFYLTKCIPIGPDDETPARVTLEYIGKGEGLGVSALDGSYRFEVKLRGNRILHERAR